MNQLPERVTDASLPDDPRLLEAVRAYQAEWEAGRCPERKDYFARHPDLVQALEICFDGLDLVQGARPYLTATATTAPGLAGDGSPLRPEQALGDFRIVREIGRGGMGIVYEAVQLSLGRPVALKVLPFAAAIDERNLQRFKTEAQAAAMLHHTNIVPVHAVGCERGMHFYAMQMIEGQSVASLIDAWRVQAGKPAAQLSSVERSLPATNQTLKKSERFRGVARFGAQAARALEHAHKFGVIHRDIKPANLLVDQRGNLWITDFGLAQFRDSVHLTGTGDLVGTLRYMSPEQASGLRVLMDQRTDIYSLGATLYEMLALEPIFTGETRQALLRQILDEEPRPPRFWNKSIPPELETIVLKAVSKNPGERYQAAGLLADDLQRFLDDQPILARRPSIWDRGRKWARRHPAVVGAGVVLLFLSCLGLVVNNWMVEGERAQTKRAYEAEKERAREAEQRFQQAQRSVDFIIQVCEGELADQPHMHALRRKLLDFALAHYQAFEEQRRGDPAAQAELASTQTKIRGILDELALLQGSMRLFLLNEKGVQEDLQMTRDQRHRLDELSPPWPDMNPSDKRQQKYLEWVRLREGAVGKVLTKEQTIRLEQIDLQRKGPLAFTEPVVVAALTLTGDQQEKIKAILQEANPFFGDFPRGPGGQGPGPGGPGKGKGKGPPSRDFGPHGFGPDGPEGPPGGFMAYYESRSKKTTDQILDLLSEEQKTKWLVLIGRPFTPLPNYYPKKGPNREP